MSFRQDVFGKMSFRQEVFRQDVFRQDVFRQDVLAPRNLVSMTKKMENPEKRAEHNVRNLVSMTKRMENPDKRAEQNVRSLVSVTNRMENPEKRAEHNRYVLQKYKNGKGDFISVTIDYFFQISEGPTCVCSCCGCLHFRKSVESRLDSMGDQTIIC